MAQDSRLWEKAYKVHKIQQHSRAPYSKSTKSKHRQYNLATFDDPKAKINGSENIKARIAEINGQMAVLKRERQVLKKRLKPWLVEYEKKPWQLYALRLEGGHWYIGMSRNPEKRYKRHGTHKGANWTKLHKPIEIVEIRNTLLVAESRASDLEDDMTIEYALKYGSELVRGGGFCQTKPHWPDVIIQNEKLQ